MKRSVGGAGGQAGPRESGRRRGARASGARRASQAAANTARQNRRLPSGTGARRHGGGGQRTDVLVDEQARGAEIEAALVGHDQPTAAPRAGGGGGSGSGSAVGSGRFGGRTGGGKGRSLRDRRNGRGLGDRRHARARQPRWQ